MPLQMNDPSRSQPTAGIQIRFIHLLVLSAFTTAQPIYDLLTRHPEFLPAHQSERVDILLLTLMLSLLLPGAAALVVGVWPESIRSWAPGPTWACWAS